MANNGALLQLQELWKPASTLQLVREEPKFQPLQIPALNRLLSQGLMRGVIAEINGRRSAGRTSISLHILAQATSRGEICAVIDTNSSFHPASAYDAGVQLDRLVWARCQGSAEHAICATDLLLHAGGFGVVLLDLCETRPQVLNRIPLSYWYRFRRAVENTPTILLVCADSPQTKSCAFSKLDLRPKHFHWTGQTPFQLLRSLETAIVLRRRSILQAESVSIPWVA
jgi:hypothetical protein